jgi:hypothetical protein
MRGFISVAAARQAQRERLNPGLPHHAHRLPVVQQRASRPVPARGQRPVPGQLQARMVTGAAAWPGLYCKSSRCPTSHRSG